MSQLMLYFPFSDPALLWEMWRGSVLAAGTVLVVLLVFKFGILRLLQSLRDKLEYDFLDDLLKAFDKPIDAFFLIFALYSFCIFSPIAVLSQHPSIDKILRSCLVICTFAGLYNLCDAGEGFILHLMRRANVEVHQALAGLLSTLAHILCVALAFVMVAKEWNYDISAFIASLGIGAMAFAFAAKDTLANVFGSIVIVMERPFQIGDWIQVNNIEGLVEDVTFRSTRIRTFYQELVYVPNNLLSNTPITNCTRRKRFRIQYSLGVTYGTTRDQMEALCAEIRNYCEQNPHIDSRDISAYFYEFGDSSLNIRIVCYIAADHYNQYLAYRQQFNLALLKILEDKGVSCAFPSQSLYFETPLHARETMEGTVDLRRAKGVRVTPAPDDSPKVQNNTVAQNTSAGENRDVDKDPL